MHKAMKRIRDHVKEPRLIQRAAVLSAFSNLSVLPWSGDKESGVFGVHEQTAKLGTMSGKNDTRDFWNFADIPIATCQFEAV